MEQATLLRPAPGEVGPDTDIIATFQDGDGNHIPITKGCVEVVFVEDRPHFNHCLVTVEGSQTFLQTPDEIMEQLLESGVKARNEINMPDNVIVMYANYMARRHGPDPVPELIV